MIIVQLFLGFIVLIGGIALIIVLLFLLGKISEFLDSKFDWFVFCIEPFEPDFTETVINGSTLLLFLIIIVLASLMLGCFAYSIGVSIIT